MSGAKRLVIVIVLFLAGLGVAAALHRSQPPEAASPAPGTAQPAAAKPQRIVALAPNITESLFALGVGGRVVGVGDFCFFPPEAKAKPRVGGEFNPNFERLLVLRPNLTVVQGVAEKVEEFGQRRGIRVLHVNMDSLPTIYAGLARLGQATGTEGEAERLAAKIKLDLAAVAYRVAGRPRPKVLLCMNHQAGSLLGASTVNGKSFLSELLDVAGGDNVFADLELPYQTFSKEALLKRRADVVIELRPGETLSEAGHGRLLDDWRALSSLPAVREQRVYFLTDDCLLLAGPRVAKTAERLAEVLHPRSP